MKKHTPEEKVRDHSYDGIQEYDKSLPNWWLFTLYGAIAFAIAYWFYDQKTSMGLDQNETLARSLEQIERTNALARAEAGILDDASLWAMSRQADVVAEGQGVYASYCAPCHGANLEGGIGANLVDATWIHGGDPLQVRETVLHGVPAKGMMAWLPIIGEDKITQVTAFILSRREP